VSLAEQASFRVRFGCSVRSCMAPPASRAARKRPWRQSRRLAAPVLALLSLAPGRAGAQTVCSASLRVELAICAGAPGDACDPAKVGQIALGDEVQIQICVQSGSTTVFPVVGVGDKPRSSQRSASGRSECDASCPLSHPAAMLRIERRERADLLHPQAACCGRAPSLRCTSPARTATARRCMSRGSSQM